MEGTRVPVEDDRSLSSFPAAEQTEWADVSPLLDSVCEELQVGELIHGENFSLFEAMSALEIMDPKMDAGMKNGGFSSVEEAIASGAAPIWLSVSQTIDVMDHLLACEATWHKGHSLAQTVFSCLYLLNMERTSPNSLLHAYCRIIRGTCNIIRSVVSKARTHEEEDLFTMAFGLPLKGDGDEKCLSMLNAVEETIARKLRACKNSKKKMTEDYEPLQKDPNLEDGFCKAVLSRLRFRKAFYHVLSYMEKSQGRGLEMAHKHIILGLSELAAIRESSHFLSSSSEGTGQVNSANSTTASGQAAVGFDANINSRLLAPTPPRLIELLSWKEAIDYFEKLLQDLDRICLLPLNPCIEEILQFITDFHKFQPDLVARAQLQLLLIQDGKLFGRDHLPDVLCRVMNMPQLMNNQDFQRNVLVTQLGQLTRNFLRILCTNTAWQRRKLGKSLQEWGAFLHQAEIAQNNQREGPPGLVDKSLWIKSMMGWAEEQTCWIAARFLLLGFELELYCPSEFCMIYWYLDHVLLKLLHYRGQAEKERPKMSLSGDLSKKKGKKRKGQEEASPSKLLLQCYICLCRGLAWMLAALSNGYKFICHPTVFNTEQERFIQMFELLQKSPVPEPVSYLQFKQSTIQISLPILMQNNYFGDALSILKKLRHCFAKDSERLDEIRRMDQVAERNQIALSVIHQAGYGDSFPRVSFEFLHHPCFAVAVIKRS